MGKHLSGFASILIGLLVGVGCSHMNSTSRAHPGAKVWTLNDPHSVGGQTTEVLGNPIAQHPGIAFNGKDDGLMIATNPVQGLSEFTIEALIKPDSVGTEEQRFVHFQDVKNNRGLMELRLADAKWSLDTFLLSGQSQRALLDRTKTHPADQWTWVAMTYKSGLLTSYVNGQKELEGPVDFAPMDTGTISLGVRQNKISWFKGGMREVRFTPTALPSEQLQNAMQGQK